jgi:ferrous iron transport protein B
MWFKALQYLKKMGGIILIASILIWALGYFPRDVEFSKDYAQEIELINANNFLTVELKTQKINALEMERKYEMQEKSYIGQMGKFIEPIIEPLGFDWKIGVSIIAGLAAKEIIVSTMGVLYYSSDENGLSGSNLQANLQSQTYKSGQHKDEKIFSPLVSFGLMIFVLLYFPCVATIAAIRKESNTKWSFFAALYTTVIAWLVAFLIHQVGSLF